MVPGKGFIYPWWFDAAIIVLRYFVLAGAAYFVFHIWKHRKFAHLKIRQDKASGKVIRGEILYSISTLLIYCGASYAIFLSYAAGYTKIYHNIHQYGYGYFFFSIMAMLLLHDTYFYWTHRLIHHPRLYKKVHLQHHLSHNPTPWASFAFHPFEALVSIGIIPLIVFGFPAHPFALFAFLTIMTMINVMGHLGYEVLPARYRSGRIGRWQNTATNHHLHHSRSKYNFGLYFTFWDKWMGTYRKESKAAGVETREKAYANQSV